MAAGDRAEAGGDRERRGGGGVGEEAVDVDELAKLNAISEY